MGEEARQGAQHFRPESLRREVPADVRRRARQALAPERRRAVARAGPLAGARPPHAPALPGALHAWHHGAHSALRGDHPDAEEGPLQERQERQRAARRLADAQVPGRVRVLHDADAGQAGARRGVGRGRLRVGEVHRLPVGQGEQLGGHEAADPLPHRRGHVLLPPGDPGPLRAPGGQEQLPRRRVGPQRRLQLHGVHADVQVLRQDDAGTHQLHVREVPQVPQGCLHRLRGQRHRGERRRSAREAEAALLQLSYRQNLPPGGREEETEVSDRAARIPYPRRRQG
mmetsp:Transcript_51824/g.138047  ORF Transcript_51824/g.138047 Transcript_51824/m.138047 type:complete len:285 (+) Transcript_51824:872-1726(+)